MSLERGAATIALDIHFEDGRKLHLARGDSLYFDSRIGHAYVSTSRRLAVMIGVCTSESSLMKHARERELPPARPARSKKSG